MKQNVLNSDYQKWILKYNLPLIRLHSCRRELAEFASFWKISKLQSVLLKSWLSLYVCFLPLPTIRFGSRSVEQYLKKQNTVLVQTVPLLLSKSLIHTDTLKGSLSGLLLQLYYVIISQLPVISFPYPSEMGKCVYLPPGDADIDGSFLLKAVLLQQQ